MKNLLVVLVFAGGCAGKFKRELVAKTKSVGILSLTVDRIGEDAGSAEVMQSVAASAIGEYEQRLAQAWSWRVVPSEQLRSNAKYASFADLARSEIVRAELNEWVEQGKMKPS